MTSPEQRFEQYLRSRDHCMTEERRQIVRAAYAVHDHFTADDLLAHLQTQDASVSRASVYRTLNLLVESGMVRRVDFDRGCGFFEHVHGDDHHDHMVCMQCGSIDEFADPELEELQDRVCREAGFRPERHSLKIFGVCSGCTNGGSKK